MFVLFCFVCVVGIFLLLLFCCGVFWCVFFFFLVVCVCVFCLFCLFSLLFVFWLSIFWGIVSFSFFLFFFFFFLGGREVGFFFFFFFFFFCGEPFYKTFPLKQKNNSKNVILILFNDGVLMNTVPCSKYWLDSIVDARQPCENIYVCLWRSPIPFVS